MPFLQSPVTRLPVKLCLRGLAPEGTIEIKRRGTNKLYNYSHLKTHNREKHRTVTGYRVPEIFIGKRSKAQTPVRPVPGEQ